MDELPNITGSVDPEIDIAGQNAERVLDVVE